MLVSIHISRINGVAGESIRPDLSLFVSKLRAKFGELMLRHIIRKLSFCINMGIVTDTKGLSTALPR